MFYLIFVFLFGLIIGSFECRYLSSGSGKISIPRSFFCQNASIFCHGTISRHFLVYFIEGKCRCRQNFHPISVGRIGDRDIVSAIFHFLFNGQSIFRSRADQPAG